MIAITALGWSTNAFSQVTDVVVTDSTGQTDKRVRFGCGFGLSFVGGTSIALSLNLIYQLGNRASIGAGVQGSYTSIKDLQEACTPVLRKANCSETTLRLLSFK